jgi:uncharacterized protein (DUF934 family)
MPLVKHGKITNDTLVHVADDAEIPGEGAILIPAARFLEDAEGFSRRVGRTGVIWPNNRDVDDLVPYLARLAVIALVFPTFRDGRAYSQARLLRERHGFKGELRATGQVLRDQFVFMLRAGFDAFEVKKESDAEAFAATVKRYSVFYQPTGDGRLTALHRRMQLRHSESASQ